MTLSQPKSDEQKQPAGDEGTAPDGDADVATAAGVGASKLESPPCPVCSAAETSPCFTRCDRYGTHEPFDVVRCDGCGLMRVSPRPRPEAIGPYYADTYSWKADEPAESLPGRLIHGAEHWYRFHLLRYQARKMRRYTHARPGAEILDVGCGSGDRLLVYRDMGYSPYGVEISTAADYARDHLGLCVRRGTLSEARYEDDQFDVITLYNVLEHLHDPASELAEIRRILKPGGAVAIEVPNTDCLQFRWFGQRWSALDVPRDLYYWNPRLLSQMLEKSGYEVEKVDQWSSWLHPPMIVLTLAPSLDPRLVWAAAAEGKGSGLGKRLAWAALTLTTPPFAALESLLGRGSSMVFYGRKPPR